MSVTSIAARRQDDRSALAAAIAEATKAKDQRHEAIERAEALLSDAESRLVAAEDAVNAARSEHAKQVVQEITAGSRPAPSSLLRSARAAAEDAEDAVTAGRAALRQLESGAADLESTAWLAQQQVECEIDRIIAPIARRILEEVKHLETELTLRQDILKAIHGELGAVPDFSNERACWRARELRLQAIGGPQFRDEIVRHFGCLDIKQPATAGIWRQAREALRLDSAVVLPVIER